MREACALFITVLSSGTWANPCLAQADGEIQPTGIYLNTFTGPFSGTEWFQVTPLPGENRFLFTGR